MSYCSSLCMCVSVGDVFADGNISDVSAVSLLMSRHLSNLLFCLRDAFALSDDGSPLHDQFEAAVAAQQLAYCAMSVQFPHLSQHVNSVLPSVLRALDHPSYSVKMHALRVVPHLVENLPTAELQWCVKQSTPICAFVLHVPSVEVYLFANMLWSA